VETFARGKRALSLAVTIVALAVAGLACDLVGGAKPAATLPPVPPSLPTAALPTIEPATEEPTPEQPAQTEEATPEAEPALPGISAQNADQVTELLVIKHSQAPTPVFAVAYSPNGDQIASLGFDKVVRVWNPSSGELICEGVGHTDFGFALTYSPDGSVVASSTIDGTLRYWDAETCEQSQLFRLPYGAASMDFSPDSSRLVISGERSTRAYVLDAYTGEILGEIQSPDVNFARVDISPDGLLILTASQYGMLMVYDLESLEPRGAMQDALGALVYRAVFSPDNKWVAASSDSGKLYVWDADFALHGSWLAHGDGAQYVEWSPDSKLLVSASTAGEVAIWDAQSGDEIRRWSTPQGTIWSIAFAPDGRSFVTAGDDGTLRVWGLP
jgi:WD40 repeat protein